MRFICPLLLLTILTSCSHKNQSTSQDDWRLTTKKIYKNTVTKEGYLDTSYITTYHYKNGMINDSTFGLIERTYSGKKLSGEKFYYFTSNKTPKLTGELQFSFSGKDHISTILEKRNGNLHMFQQFRYDTAGRNVEVIDYSERSDMDLQQDPTDNFDIKTDGKHLLDSTKSIFEYNPNGTLAKVSTFDLHGKPVRTEINLYSGKDPVSNYVLNENGDTIQRMKFSNDRKMRKQEISLNTGNITRWLAGNRLLQVISEDVKKHKTKINSKYDHEGFLIEKRYYTAQ